MTAPPVLFRCSPRQGGNSDMAARMFLAGLRQAGGDAREVRLADYAIEPCLGCGACRRSPGRRCVLADRDQAEELFGLLLAAPFVLFASPIYFYHLPAHFKAFIDRSQSYYEKGMALDPSITGLPRRTAHVILVAGRPTGERLFEGSLLTLKYFLVNFKYALSEPLTLRGKDGPDDLAADEAACALLRESGAAAWRSLDHPA
ncbi:flavodoxin family protein [Desulfocurvibacter africanus]|uniref:flavodoxin family protein n=1 Tax=Desulfocurvibacter africanus TaxID=873 RepID=UPI002FDA2961